MAMVADEANVSREGKLNVLGVFDRIAAAGFPTRHPRMVFVFKLEARYGEEGKQSVVRVRLMDEDGGVLFDASGDVIAPRVEPGDVASAYQIFPLMGATFEAPGAYKFVINVDDQLAHETLLYVMSGAWPTEPPPQHN